MKLPNGYGSVYKLPGNRRKPWAVRITVSRKQDKAGKTHWKYKYLGYYAEQADALIALAEYNKNPYDMDDSTKFEELFNLWSEEHYKKTSKASVIAYNAAYKICTPLYQLRFVDLRKSHLQGVVDSCGKNYPTLRKVKLLLSMLYTYAMENDICSKDYSQFVDIKQYKDKNPNSKDRKPFTSAEIETIWGRKDGNENMSIILILIYSGVRIGELLDLKKEHINLDEKWFDIKEAKTRAGIRRVPIADKILPFFKGWYNKNDCSYLLSTSDNKPFLYRNYYDSYWKPLMEQMSMSEHRPHDTRHTCISLLAATGIDERIIKKIVGHQGQGVTEIVYTHFEFKQLLDAINQI